MALETSFRTDSLARADDAVEEQDLVQIIRASRGYAGIRWGEIWRYRELLYFLTWRDVKIRYKQTVLGAAWAILQPFLTMVVFSLIFGRLAGLGQKTGGVAYPIYVYVGLLPWTFFANSIGTSGHSLVASTNLITKVYFPRLIIPLSAVMAGLVDLAFSFLVLGGMMIYYGVPLSWQVCLVPLLLVGTMLTATGVGAILSALTVAYRDFRYVIPFMLQLWFFVTPVIYPASLIPKKWLWLTALNPMAGLIEGFRSALLSGTPASHAVALWPSLGVSLVVATLLFLAGAAYFTTLERRFADII